MWDVSIWDSRLRLQDVDGLASLTIVHATFSWNLPVFIIWRREESLGKKDSNETNTHTHTHLLQVTEKHIYTTYTNLILRTGVKPNFWLSIESFFNELFFKYINMCIKVWHRWLSHPSYQRKSRSAYGNSSGTHVRQHCGVSVTTKTTEREMTKGKKLFINSRAVREAQTRESSTYTGWKEHTYIAEKFRQPSYKTILLVVFFNTNCTSINSLHFQRL